MKHIKFLILFLLVLISPAFLKAEMDGVTQSSSELKLYGLNYSPYVRKALSSLYYMNVDFTFVESPSVSLAARIGFELDPEYIEASYPLGKIPALMHGNFGIADSQVIIRYVEKITKEASIHPEDSKEFARVLFLEKYADTEMGSTTTEIFRQLFRKSQPQDQDKYNQAKEELVSHLDYIEEQLLKSPHTYLASQDPSVADFAIIHHFVSLLLVNETIDPNNYPQIDQYLRHMFTLDAVQRALPEAEKEDILKAMSR